MDFSKIKLGALNPPYDKRDILFGEIASSTSELPKEYYMPYAYISSQGTSPDCTAHAQAGASNENNGLEASKLNALPDAVLIDPTELGVFGHSIGAINSDGGYINWAFKYLIQWGYITGYTIVSKDVNEIKNAIYRNGALVTGSNSITWSNFLPNWIARHVDNSPGHAFRIDGWSDVKQAFRITNSWGESWGDGGFFWVKYSDVGLLYTIYAFHDKNDTSKILRAKAKNLGIWNGVDGDKVATRNQCVIIGSRIMGKFGADYDLLSVAKLNKIYDGTRGDEQVSLFEAKTIFTRLGVTKTPKGITRGQLVECIN